MGSLEEAPSIDHDQHDALAAISPLVMGGAGFSYQLHPDPESLPVRQIILKALEYGLRTFDTSPYYEPSEQLMGAAFSHPEITSKYRRSDYILMTKVGRIDEHRLDYSPAWIRKSVARSLQRFQTSYLDVVFCHDVELVTEEEAITAVGTLFELAATEVIKNVGISGYDIDVLIRIANRVRARYGRPIDIVQNWAQLTLQNTQLESRGVVAFQDAGIRAVCSSSPLACGLLRNGGLPVGRTGDWHPAPPELRLAAQKSAEWVEAHGDSLASVALRFAISRAMQNSRPGFTMTTITGISTMSDLEQNVETAMRVLQPDQPSRIESPLSTFHTLKNYNSLDIAALVQDEHLYRHVRDILGAWVDYDFSSKSKKQEIPAAKDVLTNKGLTIISETELAGSDVQTNA